MLRRTLLQVVASLIAVRPVRALARMLQAPPFSTGQVETLSGIADVVLPSALSAQERKQVVDRFVAWFVNYRQGADMGHGYGASTVRQPSGPSPVSRYPPQFAAIENAARERGGGTFASLPVAARREIVEKLLNEPQPITRLPAQPTGANLIADLMGSYFTSADAWDLCYRAEIQRDSCRTLDNSTSQPRPIAVGRGFSPARTPALKGRPTND
ncbi:MAG TPA: hypothetical protein VN700_03515 [Vicinamibacterales bacterium]|nr:hypothetical protein [Vicinamibacterales bacterium]